MWCFAIGGGSLQSGKCLGLLTQTFILLSGTLNKTTRWIAQLGSFLGRKSDWEPGITNLWRDWLRLQDTASTW